MRRLILMRHAKSSWTSGVLSDHERPLKKRGQRDAPRMARALRARGWAPALVHSSDSRRTRETWARMAPELDKTRVDFTRDLYLAKLGAIQRLIAGLDDDQDGPVLLLGHNPGMETALEFLCGQTESMTTANAALLEAKKKSWKKLSKTPDSWELVALLRPKEL
jgi:phosphohistidine phosphatase